MSPDNSNRPVERERPEIQPHGTTKDQINEMESEGQGQSGGATKDPNEPASPPAHQPAAVPSPRSKP